MAEMQDQKDSVLNEVKDKYSTGKKKYKLPYEKTWFINHAFIMGQHYISYDDVSRTFIVPPAPPQHRRRAVINWPLAYFRRTKSKLAGGSPVMSVYPATPEAEDQDRAELATMLLDYEWDRLSIKAKRQQLVGWALTAGTAFYHPYWDASAGPSAEDETGEVVRRGELGIEVVSPFEVVIDPFAVDMESARWVVWTKVRPISWVKERYKNTEELKPDTENSATLYERKMQDVIGVFGFMHWSEDNFQTSSGDKAKPDTILVHQYWERPSQKHPRGRLVVVAGNTVLLDRDNPYDGDLPFIKFSEIEVVGRFWGMSVVEQMVPLTRNLNKARSEQMENRLMSRPKWLIPRVCKHNKAAFTEEAGELIEYTAGPRGERPNIENPSPPSGAHIDDIRQTTLELQEITGWHEVSRGMLPSAETSGKAIQLLQFADDTQIAATMRQLEIADEQLSRWLLKLANMFYAEERMIRVVGDDKVAKVASLRGEQLTGKSEGIDYFDVRIQEGTGFYRSREQARNEIQWLISVGLLNPQIPKDQRRIARMIRMGTVEDTVDEDKLDADWARQENKLMANGNALEGYPQHFENHEIHLAEHRAFQKSDKYRQLASQIPTIVELFERHTAAHADYILRQTAEPGDEEQVMAEADEGFSEQPAGGE